MNATLDALMAFGEEMDRYRTLLVGAGAEMDAPAGTLQPTFRAPRVTWLQRPVLEVWPCLFHGHALLALLDSELRLCALHAQVLDGLSGVMDAPDLVVSLELPDGLYSRDTATGDGPVGRLKLPTTRDAFHLGSAYLPFAAQATSLRDRIAPLWNLPLPRRGHPTWFILDEPVAMRTERTVAAATWQDALVVDEALHWPCAPNRTRNVRDVHRRLVGSSIPTP